MRFLLFGAALAQRAAEADIVITSALIPGREPPILLHAETVEKMKPGSVVIDLAAGLGENGSGNCPLTEANKVVVKNGVTLVGYTNLPSMVSADASALYARNVFEFMKLIVAEGKINLPSEDELVKACLLCSDGNITKNREEK